MAPVSVAQRVAELAGGQVQRRQEERQPLGPVGDERQARGGQAEGGVGRGRHHQAQRRRRRARLAGDRGERRATPFQAQQRGLARQQPRLGARRQLQRPPALRPPARRRPGQQAGREAQRAEHLGRGQEVAFAPVGPRPSAILEADPHLVGRDRLQPARAGQRPTEGAVRQMGVGQRRRRQRLPHDCAVVGVLKSPSRSRGAHLHPGRRRRRPAPCARPRATPDSAPGW